MKEKNTKYSLYSFFLRWVGGGEKITVIASKKKKKAEVRAKRHDVTFTDIQTDGRIHLLLARELVLKCFVTSKQEVVMISGSFSSTSKRKRKFLQQEGRHLSAAPRETDTRLTFHSGDHSYRLKKKE